jgi:PAS domain S-box-containing protein
MVEIKVTYNILFALAIYATVVVVFIWLQNRKITKNLSTKETEMQRRMYEVSILKELAERIGYSLNVQKIVDVITSSLQRLLPYSTVSYILLSDEGKTIFHCIIEETVSKKFIEDVKNRLLQSFEALVGIQIKKDELDESISGTITDESIKGDPQSFFNIPVVINNRVVGILNVSSLKPGLYKEDEMTILYTIMNQASTAVSKLENILNQEKGKLNSMVESMADGVLMVDMKNRLLVINPATKEMLGITNKQANIFDVLDALSSKMDLRTKIEEAIKQDQLEVVEQIGIGARTLRVLITPVKDSENQPMGAVVLLHDITKEKAIEKMRDDFTSMMVHELRSPLTGIRSIANLLREDKIKNEQKKYQDFIDLIVNNSTSMLDLVNDLLDVAKLEAGKFQVLRKDTDLGKLVQSKVQSFASLAQENKLTLQEKLGDLSSAVSLDENKIGQVYNNFISNAIKFTKSGGKIDVCAFIGKKGETLSNKVATLGMIWPGMKEITFESDQIVIAVVDSGMGIPEDQMAKLFNKFTQLEQSAMSEKKGTGLGLVISKGVVEAHDGKVGVFSEVGKGSVFYALIPVQSK